MGLRAWARVIYSAANSPATAGRRGFTAGLDTATGRVTFSLDRPTDRTEACVLCNFIQGSVGTGSPALSGGQISADLAAADTTLEVRMYSSGALADPVVGTGFCVGVFDSLRYDR